MRSWALLCGGLLIVAAVATPTFLAPLNRIWKRIGVLLSRIVSPIALGVLFFGVLVPTGLLMRLFGRDPMRLRFDRNASTYWIDRKPTGPAPDSMKRQF